MAIAAQAALIAEGFTPRLRYSGSSIGYQLASITARSRAEPPRSRLLASPLEGRLSHCSCWEDG
jgi:hypothetical protein